MPFAFRFALALAVLPPTALPAFAQQRGAATTRLVFTRQPVDAEGHGIGWQQIWVMNGDGTGARRLFGSSWSGSPALAPDGGRIAFAVERDLSYTEIYVMNVDGSSVTRLTSEGASSFGPAWSPDGRRIAFASDMEPGNVDVYVMNTDGTGLTRLTDHPDRDGSPSWSPDGSRIAFVSERDGNEEIYTMGSDGSGPTRLTRDSARDRSPAWSPDGRHIAFTSDREGNNEIYVMTADGSVVRRLTSHSGHDGNPAWSPDGRRIVFASDRGGRSALYVMNADGSGQTQLTRSRMEDGSPSWAAVGAAPVAVASADTGAPEPGTLMMPSVVVSGRRLPVVVFLPFTTGTAAGLLGGYVAAAERNAPQGLRGFDALAEQLVPAGAAGPGGGGFAAIVVAGVGSADDYLTGDNWWRTILRYERQVLADLSRFAAEHPLDTTRVILAGYSLGGDLAWAIALRNPSRVRGALVMGSRAGYRAARAADHRALAEQRLRFYFAMGEGEELVRINGARAATGLLRQLGVTFRLRELPGLGHDAAPLYVVAEALTFLLEP